MPKGRHTHYLRTSSSMQLSGMRSHERNHGANINTKIYIAIYLLVFYICLIAYKYKSLNLNHGNPSVFEK